MSETPTNGLSWRVGQLEREIEGVKRELRDAKPDVHAERVARLAEDMRDLRRDIDAQFERVRSQIRAGDETNAEELGTQRKILISAWVSIATGLILAYVLGSGGIG